MDMDEAKKDESQVSLPDQFPIKSDTSSSETSLGNIPKLSRSNIAVKKAQTRPLDDILKPKTAVRKRYFTDGVAIDGTNMKDLSKEPSPFQYPKDLEEFGYKVMTKAWRNEVRITELKAQCSKKPSYKGRQKKDILNRLYVDPPKIDTMKTVLDIDPEYFKIIEGRPIPDRLSVRKYIDTVRDSLRLKIVNGYREDDIMLIQENLLLEQKIIDSIRENYMKYVNVFEEFLYRDHTSSMKLLKDSDKAANEAYDKYLEYKEVAKKFGALRSSLYNSEEKWRNCLMYEKFLFLVSPYSWKKDVRDNCLKKRSLHQSDEELAENVFSRYRLSDTNVEISLEDLVERLNEECAEAEEPQLYFTDPEQLLDVFRFMEMQNLNSLLHSEELAVPLEQVRAGMKRAEEVFDEEINNLQEIIDRLEGGISWEEDRAEYLEDLALKLIENEFKDLVMADQVLNLHVFVEDVYETRIGPNDANLSIAEMMKSIEERYRNELLSLDKVPADQVAVLEGSCYLEQMMVMRLAEKAAKQYQELQQIIRKLNKAFAPPYERPPCKELKNRSPPIQPKLPPPPQPRELTAHEAEYLEFFTDFCKHSDNPADYGIDTSKECKEEVKKGESVDQTSKM